MKNCSKCGGPSFILNKNGLCVSCVFDIDSDPNESKIFKETGEELKKQDFDLNPVFNVSYENINPVCCKCNKPVDIFGPIYLINYACSRIVLAKCHGEIEVRMISEYVVSNQRVKGDLVDLLSKFFLETE